MLSHAVTQLQRAIALARLVVPHGLSVPAAERSPYQKVIIGFAELATKQAEALLWAIENGNKPAGWSALRVLTEMIFSLDFINEDPRFQARRSCLLLREAPERGIRLHTSPHSPFNDPAHPGYAKRLKDYQDQLQDLEVQLAGLQAGPDDPDHWIPKPKKPGVSARKRAVAGNWQPHYDFLYEIGSAFVHADGYALADVRSFTSTEATGMAEQGNILLMCIILDLVQEYPAIEQVPEVDAAWEAYKIASAN
jgi:hypothetical protein